MPNKQQTLYDKSEIFLKPIKPLEKDETFTRISLDNIIDSSHQIRSSKFKPMPPINSTIVS